MTRYTPLILNFIVSLLDLLQDLSPNARVATALAPILVAIICRLILGKNKLTRLMLSVSTTWFAINILATPYSTRMQTELRSLSHRLLP